MNGVTAKSTSAGNSDLYRNKCLKVQIQSDLFKIKGFRAYNSIFKAKRQVVLYKHLPFLFYHVRKELFQE